MKRDFGMPQGSSNDEVWQRFCLCNDTSSSDAMASLKNPAVFISFLGACCQCRRVRCYSQPCRDTLLSLVRLHYADGSTGTRIGRTLVHLGVCNSKYTDSDAAWWERTATKGKLQNLRLPVKGLSRKTLRSCEETGLSANCGRHPAELRILAIWLCAFRFCATPPSKTSQTSVLVPSSSDIRSFCNRLVLTLPCPCLS